jgi:hypothetical protein
VPTYHWNPINQVGCACNCMEVQESDRWRVHGRILPGNGGFWGMAKPISSIPRASAACPQASYRLFAMRPKIIASQPRNRHGAGAEIRIVNLALNVYLEG